VAGGGSPIKSFADSVEQRIRRDAVRKALRTPSLVALARQEDEVRLVAYADGQAAERDVPADSVSEIMEQVRRHQSLFSYGGN
jgi:hypothetical protein